MQAIEITDHGSSGVLSVTDRTQPEPAADEVQIDVAAIGVNFADIDHRRGRYPSSPERPYVPGMEAAGTIGQAESETDMAVGDRVVALLETGAYAESIVAPPSRVFRLPDSLDMNVAAGVPVQFLTAYHALNEWGDLETADNVLIHAAAGGVGTAAVQLAAASDTVVFGTASTDEKLSRALDFGLNHPINYEEQSLVDKIDELTDGAGIDLVLDGVGGKAFYKSLDALAGFGRIVTYGVASGNVPAAATPRLFFENKSVHGFHLGHAFDHEPERITAVMPDLLHRIVSGELEVIVDRKFPLTEAAAAHEHIENRENVGKVILEP